MEKWKKEHLKSYLIRCNKTTERDLIDLLDGITDRNNYIKNAIREYAGIAKIDPQKLFDRIMAADVIDRDLCDQLCGLAGIDLSAATDYDLQYYVLQAAKKLRLKI